MAAAGGKCPVSFLGSSTFTLLLNCLVLMVAECSRGLFVASMFHYTLALASGDLAVAEKSNAINVAAYNVGRLVASQLWGACVDRMPFRNVFIIALSVAAVGHLLYILAEARDGSALLVPIARGVIGLGSGVLGACRALIILLTPPAQRTRWYSLMSAAQFVGYGVAPAVAILFGSPPADAATEILDGPHWDCFTKPAIVLGSLNLMLLPVLWVFFDPELYGGSNPRYAVLRATGGPHISKSLSNSGRAGQLADTTSSAATKGGRIAVPRSPVTAAVKKHMNRDIDNGSRAPSSPSDDRTPLLSTAAAASGRGSPLALPPSVAVDVAVTSPSRQTLSTADCGSYQAPIDVTVAAEEARQSTSRQTRGGSDSSTSDSGYDSPSSTASSIPPPLPPDTVLVVSSLTSPAHSRYLAAAVGLPRLQSASSAEGPAGLTVGGAPPLLPPLSARSEGTYDDEDGGGIISDREGSDDRSAAPNASPLFSGSASFLFDDGSSRRKSVSSLLSLHRQRGYVALGEKESSSSNQQSSKGGGAKPESSATTIVVTKASHAQQTASKPVTNVARAAQSTNKVSTKTNSGTNSRNKNGNNNSGGGWRALTKDPAAAIGIILFIALDAVSKGTMTVLEAVAPALLARAHGQAVDPGGGGDPDPLPSDDDSGGGQEAGDTASTALWFASLGAVGMATFVLLALPRRELRSRLLQALAPTDTTLLLLACLATGLGALVMANPWPQAQTLASLSVGAGLVWSIGTPVSDVLVTSGFSVLIQGLGSQGAWMGYITLAGCIGRILMPLITVVSSSQTALLLAAALSAAGVPAVLIYQWYKRKRAAAAGAPAQ